ncbi:hypothetical protein BKA70DRAFT_1409307 [Coprinopsis sp. MPI-PUGE-AT-0042]|nr:hypothetical protein BKA70DRAFT_1409307 [Coprinopsis sp. MPI-PUGE-AT-0042]
MGEDLVIAKIFRKGIKDKIIHPIGISPTLWAIVKNLGSRDSQSIPYHPSADKAWTRPGYSIVRARSFRADATHAQPSSLEQAIVVLPEDLKTGDAAFEGWRANLYHDSPSPISYRAPKSPAFARKRILTQGGSTKVGMELAIDIAPPFAFLHETQSSKSSARGCSPSQRKQAGCGKTDGGDGKGEFYVALIVLIRRQGSRSQALEMVVVEGKEVLRRRSDASRPLAHFELRFNPAWQAPPER